eukprot:SM000217S06836  [mRNA]  locus=s217:56330:60261:+ [translate_table: standard]
MAHVLALVPATRDRNACALVCRAWRRWERETRAALHLRGSIAGLSGIVAAFPSVTDLDLTDVNPGWDGSEVELRGIFQAAFPHLRKVKANVSPSGLKYIRHCWPDLREVVIGHWDGPDDFLEGRHVADLLATCSRITTLDLSWSRTCDFNDLPRELGRLPFVRLRALNLLGGPCKLRDATLAGLAQACPKLEELCFSIGQGTVSDAGIAKLAAGCRELRLLSIEDEAHDINNEHSLTGPITALSLYQLARYCCNLRVLSLVLAKYVRSSGIGFEWLGARCPRLQTLRIARFLGLCSAEPIGEKGDLCRPANSGFEGLAACRSLTELEMQSCQDLSNKDVRAILASCTKLRRLQIMASQKLTAKAFKTTRGTKCLATLLDHLRILQCDRVSTVDVVQRVRPMRDSLVGLELTCNWQPGAPSEHLLPPLPLQGFRSLVSLYLQFRIGASLLPLARAGLETCTNLKFVYLTVYGEIDALAVWTSQATDLSFLTGCQALDFLYIAMERTGGPRAVVDQWERGYMEKLPCLDLSEMEYHPAPNEHGLDMVSVEAAEILSRCRLLRKLSLGGVARQDALTVLLENRSLRDVLFHLPPDCSDSFRQEFYRRLTSRDYSDQVHVAKPRAAALPELPGPVTRQRRRLLEL